jgi:hypothetical protein
MPTAGDAFLGPGGIPISHSPLERISYFPAAPGPPSIDDLIDAMQAWLGDFLFPAIKQYTGIDLSPFLPFVNNTIDNLQLLFGFLDQDTSTFDKVAAGAYLIENVLQYTGLLATIESLGKLMTGIDGATGGLISQFFNDIRYIIGDPLGLGTGSIIIGSGPGDIPLLAPVVHLVQEVIDALVQGLIGGSGTGYSVVSLLGYLTSLVGDVAGLVSGVAAFVAAVGGGNMAGAGAALAGLVTDLGDISTDLTTFLANTGQATLAALGTVLNALIEFLTEVPAELIAGTLSSSVEIGGRVLEVLVQHLDAAGLYNAAYLTGAVNTGVTIAGNAISTLFSGSGILASQLTGAVNTGVTLGGTALGTLATSWNAAVTDLAALISGILGGGHTVSDLVAYLTAIPGAAISGITAVEQAILDAIANALGHSGTGHTPTDILGYLGAIPGSAISGALNTAVTVSGNAIGTLLGNIGGTGLYNATAGFSNLSTSLLKNLTPTGGNIGQFDASALTGALNTALTIGGQAVSTIFNGSGQFIGVLNSAATGALNTAITISGNALSTVLTNVTLSTGALNAAGLSGALNTAVTFSGTALSTLLGNLNSSGQFAAAQLTGALNTAVTVGGTALSTLSTNWNAAVTNINSLIGGVTGASTVADVATNINLAATNIAQIGTAAQNAAAGIVGSLNTAATQVQTAFSGVLNGIFGGLMGNSVTPTATTQSLATTAMNNVTSNIVGNASALMAIQAQQVQQAALMSVKFNFADYPNGALPSSFTIFPGPNNPGANGSLEIIGGRVVYKQVAGASAFSTQMARYNVTPATTDYQEVSWTTTGDTASAKTFFVRMNAAGTSGIWIDTSQFTVTFRAVVSGVFTILGAITITPGQYKSGAKYTVRIGDLSNLYKFFLYENDTLIGSVTDASHVSQLGALYRYGALSLVDFNTGPLFDQGINSWSFGDQLFLPGAPAAAFVSTSETTTSTTYANLTTTTDTVTATIGSSGMALVQVSSDLQNNTQASRSYMGFAVSGATTVAAVDSYAIGVGIPAAVSDMGQFSGSFLVTGLNPGSNTFKAKYRVSATTGTFKDRRISVIPL